MVLAAVVKEVRAVVVSVAVVVAIIVVAECQGIAFATIGMHKTVATTTLRCHHRSFGKRVGTLQRGDTAKLRLVPRDANRQNS